MNNNINKKRIEWLDVSKGIGIVLVVLGHCVVYDRLLSNIIFSFHMPLFFMLSGYLHIKQRTYIIIEKRFKSLCIPYIIFFLLGLVVSIIVPIWKKNLTLKGILIDLYVGSPEYIHNSSIWFLICLFWVVVLFNYSLIKISSKNNLKIIILIISGFAVIGLVISKAVLHFSDMLPAGRLPLDLDVVLIAAFFYGLGYVLANYKSPIIKKIETMNSIKIFLLVCVMFSISLILCILNGSVNLHGMSFGNPILYFLCAISGSIDIIIFLYYCAGLN